MIRSCHLLQYPKRQGVNPWRCSKDRHNNLVEAKGKGKKEEPKKGKGKKAAAGGDDDEDEK